MEQKRKTWSRDETLAAFNLYCKIPFGRIHKSNPEIINLAPHVNRTPSAVAMKMLNFASLDPAQQSRNIVGLANVSNKDRQIWEDFQANPENVVIESQNVLERFLSDGEGRSSFDSDLRFDMPTEDQKLQRVRLVQKFFRESVLSGYNFSCAICQLNLIKMLNASHIIPWATDSGRRADPCNGLSLCVFHDRAFDRGLITLDEDFQVVLSDEAKAVTPSKLQKVGLWEIEGQAIRLPDRFMPDPGALIYHRENVFLG